MQDKSINNALLALRKQIIREGQDGLAEVETLLRMRGVAMPAVLPQKKADAARQGIMRLIVYDGMREGHRTQAALAAYVAARRPELTRRAAYVRTTQVLQKMRKAGMVRWEAGVWRVALATAT